MISGKYAQTCPVKKTVKGRCWWIERELFWARQWRPRKLARMNIDLNLSVLQEFGNIQIPDKLFSDKD